MKKAAIIFCLLFIPAKSFSQINAVVSPGVQIGYSFGEKGGFILGAQLSVDFYSEDAPIFVGASLSASTFHGISAYHIGVETGAAVAMMEIGRTWNKDDGKYIRGNSISFYGGSIIYPYFSYVSFEERESISQIGTYIKVTVSSGGGFRGFGG